MPVMRSALALALLGLGFAPGPARADVQCMARVAGSWYPYTPSAPVISPGHCTAAFTMDYFEPQHYRLRSGPVRTARQVTCQWAWASSVGSRVEAPGDVPESVVCNLFL
jgi:hypothetical protein